MAGGYVPGGSSPAVGTAIKAASAPPALKPTVTVKPSAAPKPPAPPPVNPVNQAVNRLGIPMTDAQLQAQAQAYLQPLIQQLLDATNRQAQSGTAAIQGYTTSLAQSLAPFAAQARGIYGGAEQSQAASDAALAQRLQGGGSDQANQLAAQLGSINAPGAVNETVQAATNTGVGAGNALYGHGSASLADLIAQGAAAQSYASKLPGIAGLSGLQQAGQLQGELAAGQAKSLGELQTQIPGLVQNLQSQRTDLINRRENLRQGILSGQASERDKQAALAQERAAFGLKTTQAQLDAQYKAGMLSVAQYNAQTSRLRQQTAAAKGSGSKLPTVSTTLSKNKGYLVDTHGNPVLQNGKRVPYKVAGSGGGQSTTGQRWDAQALGSARKAHNGWTDSTGKHAPLSWQQYLTFGLTHGIPAATLIKQGRRVYSQAEIHQGLIPKAPGK